MIKEPIQREISQLQQDKPADQNQLVNKEINVAPKVKRPKLIDENTKPFFLYPRDGLYGLL
ncbi:hypothetical protein [Pedobacter xixiisoli]|uniref:Uncharacterized protein n=1 Tax=Pedobacter xixiisoli TaxID=1476464 RepID=A0A285ZWP1_9SPHI|nr:hypothetical protein [Pedobacter xixiisoli]SOD14050.1 hypothetical protein SAMN06297358_1377 [Pedobacter xixiisoli]